MTVSVIYLKYYQINNKENTQTERMLLILTFNSSVSFYSIEEVIIFFEITVVLKKHSVEILE
jgi:hypothetical protein